MAITHSHPAYPPVARYCSYQDRTKKEVRAKLQALGIVQATEQASFIQALKADRFLDEERYVASFIRARCPTKHWGKRKLQHALVSKGIADDLIQQGLAAIDDAVYWETLQALAARKKQTLPNEAQQPQKLTQYLLQKGYEPDLVQPTVAALFKK